MDENVNPVSPYVSETHKSNIPMAILGATVAALLGAFLWALITFFAKYQIGYMAIGVGLLVGFAVRFTGKSDGIIFGIIGAVFAVLGCYIGNIGSVVAMVADKSGREIVDVLKLVDPLILLGAPFEDISPIDFLFYGLAAYEGFRLAIAPQKPKEVKVEETPPQAGQ